MYVLDIVRDRLNLTERTKALFYLHQKWGCLSVGYEKVGLQSDIEHIQFVQRQISYRFNVIPLHNSAPKNDRIRALVPMFEYGRIILPKKVMYTNYEMKERDLVADFIKDEYRAFPVASHDDMLDCLAMINHEKMEVRYPKAQLESEYFVQSDVNFGGSLNA